MLLIASWLARLICAGTDKVLRYITRIKYIYYAIFFVVDAF